MNANTEDQLNRVAPAFETETEEAEWWYKNRNVHGRELLAAVKSGEARVLTKEQLKARLASSKKRSKRLALPDL